jgi:hypothetical protein
MITIDNYLDNHYIHRSNWLRAAVLVANDGIISISSLAIGVAAASSSREPIILATLAGLVAGALSMAAGEYVSVSSQTDTEKADIEREKKELLEMPNEELQILAQIYEQRGLKKEMPITFLHRMLMVQKNKCFFCECDLTDYKAIEHLTPISKGGDNDVFNLVYSCKSCNSKKRQNTLEEFAIKQNRIDWLNKWEHIFSIAL